MTAFIPITRQSRRCFGTVKDFDNLFATKRTRRVREVHATVGVRIVQHNKTALLTGLPDSISGRCKEHTPKEGFLFCAMHSYRESLVFPRSAKSDSKNGTSDRKPDGSEQDRSQLN